MRNMALLLCCSLFLLLGCNEKKTDLDLFDEGEARVTLTAGQTRGYSPLSVNIIAYLENKERQLEKEIHEAKWIIRGPNGYEREVIQESTNFQEEGDNLRDTFYFDQVFYEIGKWSVKLELDDGKYKSRPMRITVMDPGDQRRRGLIP